MTPAESTWSALKTVVAEALDLPPDARGDHLDARCPDPAQRTEAARLLWACEEAEKRSVLDWTAAEFAAPILIDVQGRESGIPEPLLTALAGRYTIERELGRGGMATVYLARDERHGRPVALKLLRPNLSFGDGPEGAVRRFRREIEIAAGLSHPHILPLYDSGRAGGSLYYITPYVDGETLRDRLRRSGRLPLADAFRLLREVARALEHSHRQHLVHRDIKPANILLSRDGDAMVADFGVARALAATQGSAETSPAELSEGDLVLGTPAYMSPEQATGAPGIDHRSDLYSFGAVAYECLTGTAPFGDRPRHEQVTARLSEVPESIALLRPEVPEALVSLVDRLLARRPDDRPRDASEVLRILDALERTHSEDGVVPDSSGPGRVEGIGPRRTSRPLYAWTSHHPGRRVVMVGAAAVVMVALGAVLAGRMMARTGPVSIAVLPFETVGDSATSDHISVGLSDGIGSDLGRLSRVIIPGYVTTSLYRESTKSPTQIGAELQVAAVLRGSVRRLDERVLVEAQLLDSRSGRQTWSRRYERPLSEMVGLQEDIARSVLVELRVRPTPGERESLNRPLTTDGNAYDLYLRARAIELAGQSRELWHSVPADNIRRAQSLYSQARDLDPGFAAARARLALMHALAASSYDSSEARRRQARLEAEAALRLRPGLPEGHQALASYWEIEGDVARAIEELELALDGYPNSAELHLALGSMLLRASRFDDAVEEFEHAARLEPSSPKAPFMAGVTYGRLRRPDDALRSYDHAISVAPDYHMVRVIKGQAYLRWYGTADTLAAALDRIPADWDPDGMATYGRFTALWVQRKHADALAALDHSRSELSRDAHVYQPVTLMRGRILEDLGERDAARVSYATAGAILEDSVAAHPSHPSIRVSLGLAYAGLGRSAEAVREARRAMELVPIGSDTPAATAVMGGAVEVFAMAGESDAAFDLLELMFSMPAGREVTIPFLRVWPGFDPLRDDPLFEELLTRFAA